tara:strand:- start:223 stop:612 length:390 start_codon:yes stop_codon:yes gene_type:complete
MTEFPKTNQKMKGRNNMCSFGYQTYEENDFEHELSFEAVCETRGFAEEIGVDTSCCMGLSEDTEVEQLASIQAVLEDGIKEAEEAGAREMGRCVMGYKWRPDGDGYRCEGGTHYVRRGEIHKYLKKKNS